VGFSECNLCLESRKTEIGQIEEDEVIIGTAGDKAKAFIGKNRCHCLRVLHDLAVVFTERGPERLFEADRLCSNGVHERTSLHAREDCLVDLWTILCVAHNRSASRSAERLMGGRRGIVNDAHRGFVHPGGAETRDMGDVCHADGFHLFSNLLEG